MPSFSFAFSLPSFLFTQNRLHLSFQGSITTTSSPSFSSPVPLSWEQQQKQQRQHRQEWQEQQERLHREKGQQQDEELKNYMFLERWSNN